MKPGLEDSFTYPPPSISSAPKRGVNQLTGWILLKFYLSLCSLARLIYPDLVLHHVFATKVRTASWTNHWNSPLSKAVNPDLHLGPGSSWVLRAENACLEIICMRLMTIIVGDWHMPWATHIMLTANCDNRCGSEVALVSFGSLLHVSAGGLRCILVLGYWFCNIRWVVRSRRLIATDIIYMAVAEGAIPSSAL